MKKKKEKSFMDTVREIDEQEKIEKENLKKKYKELEEKKRLEHEEQLKKDKIEILKKKQGLIESNDEEKNENENKNISFVQKIKNFIFFNKWWLGLAVFAVALVSFLSFQLLTKEKPDLIVLLITDDTSLQNNSVKIEEFFEGYIDDFNNNGKIEVSVYDLPMNELEIKNDYTRGNATGLSTQLQLGEAVIVITDDVANEYISSDDILLDLENQFPDSKYVKGTGFYLSETSFASRLGLDVKLDDDICIGIREVKDEYSFKKKMQKEFNEAFPVLENIINDLEEK